MEITMKGIEKSFGSNSVLRGVDFSLKAGEVHALMGENGAGKSTLMNILTGLHQADAGSIKVNGEETRYKNPKEAELQGLSFIHQEMNIWPDLTVLENLFIGKEYKNRFGWIQTEKMRVQAKKTFQDLGVQMNLEEEVKNLSVGQQQMIEIAKSLMTNAQVIIMDEPTAALTEREIDVLFKIINNLKQKNVSIVYISHRMEEIFKISDRVTVMRDGVSIDSSNIEDTNNDQVVRQMVGRDLEDYYPEKRADIGQTVFEVKHLKQEGTFEDISFHVKAGEILGFSGLMGAGRTEIMRSIFGIDTLDGGEIYLEEKEIQISDPHMAIKQGVGFLTENRKDEGLILDYSLRDNISLPSIDGFAKWGLIDSKTEKEFSTLLMNRLKVKAESDLDKASSLSGGNQQKVVLAKWIGIGSKVLILDEPTRGVDVGAKRQIYELMNELADRGVAIIMVSSDLPEILGVSDRIVVIHEGKIAGKLSREEATEEKIMTLATGGY